MATPKNTTGKRSPKGAVSGERNGAERPAAYFLSLTVENVRCFGPKQTLDLSDGNGCPAQWTIILGENGVGKTTLLQCLVASFPTSIPEFSQFSTNAGVVSLPLYTNPSSGFGSIPAEWSLSRFERNELQFISSFSIGRKLQEKVPTELKGYLGVIESIPEKTEGIKLRKITIDRTGDLNNLICIAYGA